MCYDLIKLKFLINGEKMENQEARNQDNSCSFDNASFSIDDILNMKIE